MPEAAGIRFSPQARTGDVENADAAAPPADASLEPAADVLCHPVVLVRAELSKHSFRVMKHVASLDRPCIHSRQPTGPRKCSSDGGARPDESAVDGYSPALDRTAGGRVVIQSKGAAALGLASLLVASCGFGSSGLTSTEATVPPPTSSVTTLVASTSTSTSSSTTTITTPSTTTSSTLAPLPPLPAELAAQVDELIAVTEELRGLSFLSEPMIEVLPPSEVSERRRLELEEDLDAEELLAEAAFYELFGILAPGTDLYDFYADFYSAGTLAYYDLETQRLVVPLAAERLNEYEKWILVHELTHALMDQHHPEVADAYELADEDSDFDQIGALLGLLEGEAVLIQTLYFDGLESSARSEVIEIAGRRSNPSFAAAPDFFRDLLRFPYTSGSLLATDLYRRGGVQALDQAFARPPSTTEQVIHPERYVELEQALVVDLGEFEAVGALSGYEVSEEGTWGERGWRLLLDHHLGASASAEAADGWGGDRYRILWSPDTGGVIFAARFTADTFGDASEIAGALGRMVEAGVEVDDSTVVGTTIEWQGQSFAYLTRQGESLTFVVASDPTAGAAYVAELGGETP